MASIIRQRRDSAANWATNNPVVPDGQLCFDLTNKLFKLGDGLTNYASLPSFASVAAATAFTPAGSLLASTVQAALEELDAEKQPKSTILTNTTASFTTAEEVLLSNQSGTNTGDQESASFVHDDLSGVNGDQHIDWTLTNVKNIHPDNYISSVYTHPSDGVDPGVALTGANVFSDIEVNDAGHVTGSTTRALTPADIGAEPVLGFTPENPANKNTINGYAGLDATGLISSTLLPSYVDDVVEAANFASLPVTGESGKIYVTTNDNASFRWTGTVYVNISNSVELASTLTAGILKLSTQEAVDAGIESDSAVTPATLANYSGLGGGGGGVGGLKDFMSSGSILVGKAVVINANGTVSEVNGTNLTAENFLGYSQASVGDVATVSVAINGGVDANQVGLTAGQTYYLQNDGTLSLVDTTSVIVGTAISSTELLVHPQTSGLLSVGPVQVTSELIVATAGQTVFVLSNPYVPADGGLRIYQNGVRLLASDYTKTNSTTVTMTVGASLNDEFLFEIFGIGTGSGGSGSTKNFTATGSIASAGLAVALNSDGTVSVVGSGGGGELLGTAAVFESASSNYISATFDSLNNKIVIAYSDAGNANYGTAVVGTVSGTSISFGTPVVFESATSVYISATFDSLNGKVVIAYRDDGNTSFGTAVVGTLSGTSISFGTPVVFESATIYYTSATFDSLNNKIVIAYRDTGNSAFGTAVVGTVSGTSISFGTPVVFESATSNYISTTFDSLNNKVVIAYGDEGNTNFGTAIVGTVSGTSLSFGTPAVFESATSVYISATFDSLNNKIVIAYRDGGNTSFGTAIVGTVVGNSISFSTPVVFESASSIYISATFDSLNGKVVIAYRDDGNTSFGTAVVYQTDTSNNPLTIGIAQAPATNTQLVSVGIKGHLDVNQTGLVVGSDYYVGGTGALTDNSVSGVYIGKALSATELYIDRI